MFAKLFDKATASADPQQIVSDGNEEHNQLNPHVVLHYGVPSTASCLAYDPIQHLLAIGTLDGRIKVIGGDNIEGLLISPKKLPSKNLEFFQNQGFLVTVSNEDEIQVWDLEHRCIVSSLQWQSNVTAFSVIQGTTFMYLGDEYGSVSVLKYDCVRKKLLQLTYSIHANLVSEASGIPLLNQHSVVGVLPQPCSHGNRVLLAYDNGTIILWDISLDKLVLTRGCKDLQLKSETIYACGNDPICKAKDEEPDFDQVDKEISALCWASMDGTTIAVGYVDGDIILWNLSSSAQNKGHKNEKSADNVFKIQLSSADRKFPVIVLQWSASRSSNDHVQGERLFVYGGDKIGSAEVLTILNLDWSQGREALKNVSRIDLTLSGSFADVILLQNFNEPERTLSTSLFILTSPGQLQFYGDMCLSTLCSPQQKSSSSPLSYSSFIPTSEPCLMVGRLFMLHTDAEYSKALTEMVEAARWKRMDSANDEGLKWPLSGGVPCHFPESGDIRIDRLYIAGYQDGSVQIWDATYPVLSWLFLLDPEVNGINIAGLTAPVSALDLSLTTLSLAIGNDNGLIRLYKLTQNCSKTGMLLVTGTGNEVHESGQGTGPQCTAVFSLCTSRVCTLRYTNQGDRLAVGFETSKVAMLDVSLSAVLFLTDAHSGPSSPITSFSDGILLDAHSLQTGSQLCESISVGEPVRDVIFLLGKDLHITVLDSTLGKVISSCSIKHDEDSSAISIYLLGGTQHGTKTPGEMHLDANYDDNEGKGESAAITESISVEHGQENSGGETCVQHRPLDMLILVCCTNFLQLYTCKSLVQGDSSSINEVNLSKSCCWTAIIKEDNKVHGLLLFYQTGDIEIRSLPKLEVLGESSLTSVLRWNMKANMHKTMSSTDHGQIALVNGCEFAVLSVLPGENDFRIPESLPCLHDKVLAAVAESDLNVSPTQKTNKETPSGIFGGLIKGLRASRDNLIMDPSEIYKVDQPSLGRIFTRSAKDQSSLKGVSPAKNAGKVIELSIDDIEIDEPLRVSPLPGESKDDKNDKKTERDKLFEGGTSETSTRPRTIEQIKAKYRPATGDAAAAASQAKDKLMERQEKLERLSKNSEELQNGAQNFASMAHELAKRMENRKWWQL